MCEPGFLFIRNFQRASLNEAENRNTHSSAAAPCSHQLWALAKTLNRSGVAPLVFQSLHQVELQDLGRFGAGPEVTQTPKTLPQLQQQLPPLRRQLGAKRMSRAVWIDGLAENLFTQQVRLNIQIRFFLKSVSGTTGQEKCQIECQKMCQIEGQKDCQKICPLITELPGDVAVRVPEDTPDKLQKIFQIESRYAR